MPYRFGDLITVEEHIKERYERARKLTGTELAVLIHGEEGTGKERLCYLIHRYGPRESKPFIKIDAKQLKGTQEKDEVFSRYLFGSSEKQGKILQASGGTLFIKNIEYLRKKYQHLLFKTVKQNQLQLVDTWEKIPIDVRLLASSADDLRNRVQQGTFSEKLFSLFSAFVDLPPLRERPKDILTLAVKFIKEYNRRHNLGVESISIAALQGLDKLDWKKNIKQLKAVIKKAVILANADIGTIWIEHIPVPLKLKKKLEYPRANLKNFKPEPYLGRIIPAVKARQFHLLPIASNGREVTVAMVDPSDFSLIKKIESWSQLAVKAVMAEQRAIIKAQTLLYGQQSDFSQLIKQAVPASSGDPITVLPQQAEVSSQEEDLRDLADQAPIIDLVNKIIAKAIHERASDIHLESGDNVLRIRYRIDGTLYHSMDFPAKLVQAVVSRIKVIANMDIASKRKPQDGRVALVVENREIDLRVATVPTMHGENVVMRVLDRDKGLKTLDRIGLSDRNLSVMQSLVHQPHGMILVTGPTGSGKTSTLYAALQEVNDMSKKIITVEDQIEFQIEPINQIQVNVRAGLTFSTGLRSILRLDPDIIMIGEIRDHETAELAVRAALTGHLVFSTLHTNDAPGAMTRLINMGIEPFLLSSSLTTVIGQRLIRLLCPHCKEQYRPSPDIIASLNINREMSFFRVAGCRRCKSTGYQGRTAIHELLVVDDDIRDLLLKRAPGKELRLAALAGGMEPLKDNGIAKIERGLTTVEEILGVTGGLESPGSIERMTVRTRSQLKAVAAEAGKTNPGTLHTVRTFQAR